MTPAASILDPNSNPALYVTAMLTLYVDLPDTPLRASVPDQRQARIWCHRGVPLPVVETAESARTLQAHQAQLLLAAGNPETEAAPVWRTPMCRAKNSGRRFARHRSADAVERGPLCSRQSANVHNSGYLACGRYCSVNDD
jgi:hypothetical protein